MACLITSGVTLGCRDSIGGVAEVYIGAYNGTSMGITIGVTASTGMVTAFTGVTTSFSTFAVPAETSTFTDAGEFSTDNGTALYTHTLEFVIQKITATYGSLVNVLGQGTWRIIVKDNDGNYHLLGFANGMRVSAASGGTGKAMGDMAGYTLTFSGKEKYTPYLVTTAAALSVITA